MIQANNGSTTKNKSIGYELPRGYDINKRDQNAPGISYQEALQKRVDDTFEKSRPTLIFLACVSLPIFFIAWPIGYLLAKEIIQGGAEIEIFGAEAAEQLHFIQKFSHKLLEVENLGEDPEVIFDEFIKDNPNYEKIFLKDQNKLEIISFAVKLKDPAFAKDFFKEKDAISLWEKYKESNAFASTSRSIKKFTQKIREFTPGIERRKRPGLVDEAVLGEFRNGKPGITFNELHLKKTDRKEYKNALWRVAYDEQRLHQAMLKYDKAQTGKDLQNTYVKQKKKDNYPAKMKESQFNSTTASDIIRGSLHPYAINGNVYPKSPAFADHYPDHSRQGCLELLEDTSIRDHFNRTAAAIYNPIQQMYLMAIKGKNYTEEKKTDLWNILENSLNQVMPNFYEETFFPLADHDIACIGADITNLNAENKRKQETDIFVEFEYDSIKNEIRIITHKRKKAFANRQVKGQLSKSTKSHPFIQRPYTKTQMTIGLADPSAPPKFEVLEARTTFDGDKRPIYGGVHTFETISQMEEANNKELRSLVSDLSSASKALSATISQEINDVAKPDSIINQDGKTINLNIGGNTYETNAQLLSDTSRQLPGYEIHSNGKRVASQEALAPQEIAAFNAVETAENIPKKITALKNINTYLSAIDEVALEIAKNSAADTQKAAEIKQQLQDCLGQKYTSRTSSTLLLNMLQSHHPYVPASDSRLETGTVKFEVNDKKVTATIPIARAIKNIDTDEIKNASLEFSLVISFEFGGDKTAISAAVNGFKLKERNGIQETEKVHSPHTPPGLVISVDSD